MATATFVQDGSSIDYTPSADVAAGDVVVQNDLVGIAKQPIAANALGALAVAGVFEVPKATGALSGGFMHPLLVIYPARVRTVGGFRYERGC